MPTLYVVATPIGNLTDLSPRVKETLQRVSLVAAEDTRVAMKLLNAIGLQKSTVSCHRHNEADKAPGIIARMLEENIDVALTCDAGTPGISDPGTPLVAAAWEAGIPVVPVSGPSAVVTALSASGFDARAFAFYGFLPREKKPLYEKLDAIRDTGVPVAVLYESPHRVVDLVRAICDRLPQARLCVCCDLTKLYEKITRGPCLAVLASLEADEKVEKGEYCVVVDLSAVPPVEKAPQALTCDTAILQAMLDGQTLDGACARAKEMGYHRNDIYRARTRIRDFLADLSKDTQPDGE